MRRRSGWLRSISVGIGIGIGVAIGGAVMYLYDPALGKRRRAHLRYETKRVSRRVTRSLDRTTRNLAKLSRMGFPGIARTLVPAGARVFIGG